MMTISEFGLAAIEAFEGYFAKPYLCPAGVKTQGYGHTAAAGGRPLGGSWTKAEARAVLRDDLSRRYEPGVRALIKRPVEQGQYDACVSMAFNVGLAGFGRSSVLKFLNRGKFTQAAAAFALWVKAAGKTMPGLVRRRGTESLMFRGIQDVNFDGRRQSDEPIYGAMPQDVDQAREKPMSSGTMQGTVVSGTAGAAAILTDAQEALETAEPHISSGTWIGLALGGVVLAGSAFAGYRKWRDMGSPVPWR